jgi:hypothetical protein
MCASYGLRKDQLAIHCKKKRRTKAKKKKAAGGAAGRTKEKNQLAIPSQSIPYRWRPAAPLTRPLTEAWGFSPPEAQAAESTNCAPVKVRCAESGRPPSSRISALPREAQREAERESKPNQRRPNLSSARSR